MNAAHEPSMDDILKSIRRIIRTDQDEAAPEKRQSVEVATNQAAQMMSSQPAQIPAVPSAHLSTAQPAQISTAQPAPIAANEPVPLAPSESLQLAVEQEEPRKDDSNLIRMKIHDQKRLRILEKKLQTVEMEYEQKLQLHRRKMMDYRRQNKELGATVDAYKSKLEKMSISLKTAHDLLEKLQISNQTLKDKVVQLTRFEHGTAVLKTIQREFTNLYHPDRVKGDKFSRLVRHEVYNEFSQVLKVVKNQFDARRSQ